MDRRVKPGRPTSSPSVAPPGRKWCKYGQHFPLIIEFSGSDSYCKDCRREYNRKAYLKRQANKQKAKIIKVDIAALCECGAVLSFSESGDWSCPECGHDWSAVIKARIDSE